MAKQSVPRHAGVTSRAQAAMEAKALEGPTENKALDVTPTTKKVKPPKPPKAPKAAPKAKKKATR